MKNELKNIVNQRLREKQDAGKYYYGIMGNGSTVEVPGRPGYVYVTLDDGSITQVYNNLCPNILNYPVVVGYSETQTAKGVLCIVSARLIPRLGGNETSSFNTRAHHASHEWLNADGGQDVVYTHIRQWLPMRVTPQGNWTVYIHPDIQLINGAWQQVGGQTYYLFQRAVSSYSMGASGDERYVLISLDTTTGDITFTNGELKAVGLGTIADIPDTPANNVPICAIRFWTGQTDIIEALSQTDLVDLRTVKIDTYKAGSGEGYITSGSSATLPNYRQLKPGKSMSFDYSVDNELTLSGSSALSELNDVSVSGSQSTGQVLAWVAGSPGMWAPISISGSMINHNDLANIQGGNSTQRNHLTNAELVAVQNISGSAGGASNNEPFITGGSSALLTNYRQLKAGPNINLDYSVPNELTISGSGGGGGGGGHTIQDEGVDLTARTKLNFKGAGVTATDNSGDAATDVTIPGASVDPWISDTNTWSYSSADSPTFVISVGADMTGLIGVGMRIKLTQTTAKYFIVTAVGAYSGGVTLITVYGGTDYTLADEAISNPYYSSAKAPLGFPLNPAKWTVEATSVTNRIKSSPTQNVWYNLNSDGSIIIPIGLWKVSYQVACQTYESGGADTTTQITLSTANNSESDPDFTSAFEVYGYSGAQFIMPSYREKMLSIASKTTYYLNSRTTLANINEIRWGNGVSKMIIRAICVYL